MLLPCKKPSTLALILLLQLLQSGTLFAEGRPHSHPQQQQREASSPTSAVTAIATKRHDSDPVLLQRRAQFWAGWPKTTVTLVQTITANGNPDGGQSLTPTPTTITAGVEATTTIWDTTGTGSPSGTRTVFLTTTLTSSRYSLLTTTTTTTTRGTLTPSATYLPNNDDDDDGQKYLPRFSTCNPGDEDYKEPGGLSLTREQTTTLAALAVMFLVILIGWNFVVIRYLFYPLKTVVLFIHEAGHAIPGVLGGNALERVYTDPVDGGLCAWNSPYPRYAVPLGYLSSVLVGCAFILCGFNTEASKVASFFIGILLVLAAYQVYTSPLGLVLLATTVGLMIAFWFIEHARYLRFFVLFVGVMSCFYLIWDFLDDWVFHKLHPCCLILHRDHLGFIQPFIWLYIWILITAIFFAATILLAVAVYRQSPHSMFCQGQSFLPT